MLSQKSIQCVPFRQLVRGSYAPTNYVFCTLLLSYSFEQLDADTLKALIEEFVTRQGAVHGHSETPVDRMIEEVSEQIRSGRAVILYDEEDETCTIVSRDEVRVPTRHTGGGRPQGRPLSISCSSAELWCSCYR